MVIGMRRRIKKSRGREDADWLILTMGIGNLRWRRFRGDGDRTGREDLELRQPSLPVQNRTLRSQ